MTETEILLRLAERAASGSTLQSDLLARADRAADSDIAWDRRYEDTWIEAHTLSVFASAPIPFSHSTNQHGA